MKLMYEVPEMEVVWFEAEDIIMTSGMNDNYEPDYDGYDDFDNISGSTGSDNVSDPADPTVSEDVSDPADPTEPAASSGLTNGGTGSGDSGNFEDLFPGLAGK